MAQPLDPPYRAIGYSYIYRAIGHSYTYRACVFQVSQGIALYPSRFALSQPGGGGGRGCRSLGCPLGVSRYTGVSLREYRLSRFNGALSLSGPDGSRHSSDQHPKPKDVNSKNSNYCPIFVRELLSSRRQTPEVWNFCVSTVFEFLSHLPRNSRASQGRKFRFFVFFVFCGLKP